MTLNTNSTKPSGAGMSRGEFIPLVAMMISLIALSIDAMLPVLPEMGRDLGVADANDHQLIIIVLFLGLGLAQIIYGPLSDSFGRKPAIYVGYIIFVIGCLLSIFAESFTLMLIGRFLQGVGAAGPRIICIAVVRDQYEGRDMARIMSFVMAVFILVPALAPALGQFVANQFDWRAIFILFLALAFISWTWFAMRQPETLPAEKRVPLSINNIRAGVKETCTTPVSIGYTIIAGLVFCAFVSYLSTATQIFADIFDITDDFPWYFGGLALAIGMASVINGRLVKQLGMRKLVGMALITKSILALLYIGNLTLSNDQPDLIITMVWLTLTFMCVGSLIGNVNALAMEPLGHIAGLGAAVVGTISTLLSAAMGGMVAATYDGSILPLAIAFAFFALASLAVKALIDRQLSG